MYHRPLLLILVFAIQLTQTVSVMRCRVCPSGDGEVPHLHLPLVSASMEQVPICSCCRHEPGVAEVELTAESCSLPMQMDVQSDVLLLPASVNDHATFVVEPMALVETACDSSNKPVDFDNVGCRAARPPFFEGRWRDVWCPIYLRILTLLL